MLVVLMLAFLIVAFAGMAGFVRACYALTRRPALPQDSKS